MRISIDYPHLKGALHRLVVSSNEFVGSMATYLVVLNHLPVVPKNAPLLLLAKGRKQDEFCRWLVEEDIGITWQQRQLLLYYIFKYSLIQNPEVQQEMTQKLAFGPEDYDWLLTLYEHSLEKNQAVFLNMVHKRLLNANNPQEAAQRLMKADSLLEASQKLIGANSPIEMAQKALQVDSPVELAQKALQVDSPIEMALKTIQSEEQLNEFLSRFQQRSHQTARAST